MPKDSRPKALRWLFLLPLAKETENHVSNLAGHADIDYLTYAIAYDTHGKSYIKGYVKLNLRQVSLLMGCVSLVSIAYKPRESIVGTQSNKLFVEHGAEPKSLASGVLKKHSPRLFTSPLVPGVR